MSVNNNHPAGAYAVLERLADDAPWIFFERSRDESGKESIRIVERPLPPNWDLWAEYCLKEKLAEFVSVGEGQTFQISELGRLALLLRGTTEEFVANPIAAAAATVAEVDPNLPAELPSLCSDDDVSQNVAAGNISKGMRDEEFLEKWLPLETRFRALEENYRVERIRHNGHPYPEGSQLAELENDISAALDIYISATAEQRTIMRDLFEWSYLLPDYVRGFIGLPNDLPNEETTIKALRAALAAASLENNKTDDRDTYVWLGEIWIALNRRQVDPLPYFCEAAQWSSASMRRFLRDFHKSEFFQCDVAPKLKLR